MLLHRSSYLSRDNARDSAADLSRDADFFHSRSRYDVAFWYTMSGKPDNESIHGRQAGMQALLFSDLRGFPIELARNDKSRAVAVSHTDENTKELLLDKLHVSHNESADRSKRRFAYSRIMNSASLFDCFAYINIRWKSFALRSTSISLHQKCRNHCKNQNCFI